MKKHNVYQENKQNDHQMSQTMRISDGLKKSKFMTHKKQFSQSVQIQQNHKNYSTFSGFSKLQAPNKFNDTVPKLNRTNIFKSMYCEPESKQNVSKQRNDSFYRTTSSFKFRTEAILNQFSSQNKHKKFNSLLKPSLKDVQNKKSKQAVKQNFTFRNRNIKQKIVNKISNFIREIDYEQHNNRKQNNYYNSAINKLQNTLTMCFGQFRQQSVACDADIETLQNYATFYNHNGPIPISSSCNYGQLLKFNEGGLFTFNTNSSKAEFDLDAPSNSQFNSFQPESHHEGNTLS